MECVERVERVERVQRVERWRAWRAWGVGERGERGEHLWNNELHYEEIPHCEKLIVNNEPLLAHY